MALDYRTLGDWHIAIARDPSNPANYRGRGTIYGQTGHPYHALADFSTLIQLDHNDVDSIYRRAMVHLLLGDRGSASRDLAEIVWLSPGHAEARYQLGLIRGGINFSGQRAETSKPTFTSPWLSGGAWRKFIYLLVVVAVTSFAINLCINSVNEVPNPELATRPDLRYIEE